MARNINVNMADSGHGGTGTPAATGAPTVEPPSDPGNGGDPGNGPVTYPATEIGYMVVEGKKKKRRGGYGAAPAAPKPTLGQKYDINTKVNIKPSDQAAELKQRKELSAEYNPEPEAAEIERVNKYDKTELVNNLDQQIEAARQQYNTQVDNAMDTQARDLNRALVDAQGQFQTQQDQVTANEMNALDNAALYAEARGDKGGIGQAQYNSIQNTAAQNRLQVSQAQTKLATDTARQISDLRAQGEFERADKMLGLTQQYLSELRQIEEFAANYNLSVDQINTAIQEWEYEYEQAARQFYTNTELQLANMTGMFSNGMSTYAAKQDMRKAMGDLALSLVEMGVTPNRLSASQRQALADLYGMDQNSLNAYFKRANWERKS